MREWRCHQDEEEAQKGWGVGTRSIARIVLSMQLFESLSGMFFERSHHARHI